VSPFASVLAYQGVRPVHGPGLFLACGARLVGDVRAGKQLSVWFNAVVRGDVNRITIGDQTNIQDNAVVHGTYERFATIIGNQVSIGHSAAIHGCDIEDRVLIGMGAVIMDGARIGQGSVIAAGAIVTQGQKIPPLSLVMGAPAVIKRVLSQEESDQLTAAYSRYLFYVSGFDYPDVLVGSHGQTP
jgi:carbonic anhydrase/acetyltransferase-like protein (isoleucine patch superfamily)